MKAAKYHRNLTAARKLGQKVLQVEQAEEEKMDSLLASVGLSRELLAQESLVIPKR